MPPEDSFTHNFENNDDKELLLANGYIPGEMSAEERRAVLMDLREQSDGDEDGELINPDERDGTD